MPSQTVGARRFLAFHKISGPPVRLPREMEDLLKVAAESVERRTEENRRISDVIQRERQRLFHFIRRRVDDQGDAEDILQMSSTN